MQHLLINITQKEGIHLDILSHFVKGHGRKWHGYTCSNAEVNIFAIIFRFMSINHKTLDFPIAVG